MPEKISRTTAANAKRMRASEEKLAEKLRSRGWQCTPPEERMPPLTVIRFKAGA